MIALAQAGEQGAVWQTIALSGWLFDRARRRVYVRASRNLVIASAANYAIKLIVGRRRPELPGLPPLVRTLSTRSYLSAHATTSFTGAAALARVLPASPLYVLACAMALTRPYVGVHYPSDVLAGAVLGSALDRLLP